MFLATQASTEIKDCFRLDENSVQECFWPFRQAQKSRFASGLVKQNPGYFRPDQHKKQRNKDCKIKSGNISGQTSTRIHDSFQLAKIYGQVSIRNVDYNRGIFLLQSHLKLQEYLRQGLDR
jgi:hypothetical protein